MKAMECKAEMRLDAGMTYQTGPAGRARWSWRRSCFRLFIAYTIRFISFSIGSASQQSKIQFAT